MFQVYLQQQEGSDNVVSHVEIIPSAGFVQRKPFQREDDLRREGRETMAEGQGKCWDCLAVLSWISGQLFLEQTSQKSLSGSFPS